MSGYRDYGTPDIERVEFIRKSKRLGLSLAEIKEILSIHRRQEATCGHVRNLLDLKLEQIDAALRELQGFREQLAELRERTKAIEDCRPKGGRICGIIEDSAFAASQETLAWVRASFAGPRGKE